MEWLFFIALRVAFAYGIGCLGRKRKIGFGWAFAISIVWTILGLIITLCSKKKKNDIDFVNIQKN